MYQLPNIVFEAYAYTYAKQYNREVFTLESCVVERLTHV